MALPAQAAEAAPSPASPAPGDVQSLRLQAQYGLRYTSAIEALSPYVKISADGRQLVLEPPPAALSRLDPAVLAELRASLEAANRGLRDGTLKAPAAALKAGVRLLDGSTGSFYYWWGHAYCISHRDLQWAMWGWYTSEVSIILGLLDVVLGAATYVTLALFQDMDWYGNGSCFDETWTGLGWFAPQ